jgi:hypothetical protein
MEMGNSGRSAVHLGSSPKRFVSLFILYRKTSGPWFKSPSVPAEDKRVSDKRKRVLYEAYGF